MGIDKTRYVVREVPRSEVVDFIEENHYSHSINGVKVSHCFGLYYDDTLVGAGLFGVTATRNQWKPYGTSEESVLELRRLVLIDDTPRNMESYFIGKMLKWLKKNTKIESVVSYADPNFGHQGIIYQASNFQFIGRTAKTRVVVLGERTYHDRALRTKYKGRLKPFAQRLVDAVETGEAHFETHQPKYIYLYKLVDQAGQR